MADHFDIFFPPTYEKLKVEIDTEVVEQLDGLVEYVRTISESHREHASRDTVIEYLVDVYLASGRKTVVQYRDEREGLSE